MLTDATELLQPLACKSMIVQVDPAVSASGLGKTLVLMQESGELCDFTIVVSGSEVKAHK